MNDQVLLSGYLMIVDRKLDKDERSELLGKAWLVSARTYKYFKNKQELEKQFTNTELRTGEPI